jgi:molecular chaperone IbpA
MAYNVAQDGYPPYNIIQESEDRFVIELAVAGIDEDAIDVTEHQGVLTVEAKNKTESDETNYLHKGISTRRFKRTFTLAEHVYVQSAGVKNGILSIVLERDIPEEMKPRSIPVNFG